ncbi:MAG: class I SAM-dependent methyltransferase [Candidatus Omnitrophica bacterium]|nr:class I SAM-dependent methyltransferase [Candidatus Omnitrophota bacterium]
MRKKLKNKDREIAKIIEDLKNDFPFKGYIETATDFGSVLARIIGRYILPGSKILDFGCGACDKTAIYNRMGYVCYGCDDLKDGWHLEGDNKELIKDFVRKENINFLEITDENLPYNDNTFDGILITDVMEHLHDSPRDLLNKLISKLKINGYVFIGMPNSVNIRKRISVLFGRTNYVSLESFYFGKKPWRGHVREYTLQESKRLLKYQGLSIEYANGVNVAGRKKIKNKIMRTVYSILTKLFPALSDAVLVVGRKPANWRAVLYDEEKDKKYTRKPTFTASKYS